MLENLHFFFIDLRKIDKLNCTYVKLSKLKDVYINTECMNANI